MTFNDIFKSSFLENVTAVSLLDMVLALALAFGLGMFIFLVYKKTYQGVMYSSSFGVTLVALTMITTLVILAVTSNVVLSLGMVGALSIIRFRTAIKDPMDTVFMFWSVGEGIAIGTKFYDIAIISAIIIGVVLAAMGAFKFKGTRPYILILHYDESASGQIKQMVKQLPSPRLKSKTVQRDGIEMTLELRLKDNETGFVEKFMRVEGVYDAALISHQGDIVS